MYASNVTPHNSASTAAAQAAAQALHNQPSFTSTNSTSSSSASNVVQFQRTFTAHRALLRQNRAWLQETQVFSAPAISTNTSDKVRVGNRDLLRPDPELYGGVQAEQSEDVALHDLQISSVDMPAAAKDQIFACAGSDYMMIEPRPGKEAEKVAPLEGNGAGTAGTKGWAEVTQNMLLKPAHACGEALLAHGPQALAIVVASGNSKLPEDPAEQAKLKNKSSFDKFSVEHLGRQAPTKYSHEKFYHAVSAMCDPLRHAYGPEGYEPIAYVPDKFEEQHLTGPNAHWTTAGAKPTVMSMQMADQNRADGWEAKNPNSKGEYELHFHGRKVNVFYNDGGLGQLLATLAEKEGVPQIRINQAECKVVNPTIEMATDKFQWLCAYNDFMKLHGPEYPVMVQQVPAFFTKNDAEMQQRCEELVQQNVAPILKPDNSRWGYGIKPMPADASPALIKSKITESREKLASTINAGGKNIAGRTYCVTEAYQRLGATFGQGDKREACNNFGIELRCAAIGDYDKAYANKPAGAKLRSQLAIAKLAPIGAETGNLSDTSSNIPTSLLTLPMNEAGQTATGLTQDEREQVVKFNTHLWSFVLANQDAYQFGANGEPTRTSALDPSPVTLTDVPAPH